MNKNEIIVELKKTLKNIYEEFEKRIDRGRWKNAVKEAYETAPAETTKAAAEFVMTHPHIPSASVRSLFLASDLRNRPSALADFYSEEIVKNLLKKMTAKDPLRYSLIDGDLPEKQIEAFIDAAEAAEAYLKKGQTYLASVKAAEAERIVPGHPDVALIQTRIFSMRYDYNAAERVLQGVLASKDAGAEAYELAGDIYAARKYYSQAQTAYEKAVELQGEDGVSRILMAKLNAVSSGYDITERALMNSAKAITSQIDEARLQERNGFIDKAEQIYQNIIAKDYRQFDAYYPLAMIFLNTGRREEADYLVELLLDFGQYTARTFLLKGMVLEAAGKQEDALFYYNAAVSEDPEDIEAFCHKKRLTALLDEDEKEAGQAMQALNNPQLMKNSRMSGINMTVADERTESIRRIDENACILLKRGRMTEAYYDLMKKSSEYPDAAVLSFRKAEILSLMGRDVEARSILCDLRNDSQLAEKAEDLIYDIDCRIIGEHKDEEADPAVMAEIYFNIGRYSECEAALAQIEPEKLKPELIALKGRCEIFKGRFAEALRSFDAALEADPSLKGVRLMKGMILQSKRDYKGALALYDEAMRRGEDPKAVSGIKASLLYEQDRNADLMVFRSDMEKMPDRSYDVDGYVGLVYVERTPHHEKKGIDYLENAMGAGSDNPDFYIAAARAYLTEDRCYAALGAAEAGLTAVPDSRELFAVKAEILFQLEKYEAAEMIAGTLLSENLQNAGLHFLLGKIESERGNDRDSVRWLKSAADLDEKNHTYVYAYADKCFETGDKKNAEQYYTKAIELNPKDYISMKRRAILLEQSGDDESAIADIRASLEVYPNDAEAYVILGNIVASYDIEEIEEEMENISDSEVYGAEAGSRSEDDQLPESESEEERDLPAAEGADAAQEISDGTAPYTADDAEAQKNEAEGRDETEESSGVEAAEEGAEQKKDVRPSDLMDADEIASEFERRRQDAGSAGYEALSSLVDEYSASPEFYFYKAISIDPKYRESYISLAKYQAENSRYDQALANIEKAIRLNPDLADGYMIKGIICHLKGQNDEAIQNFREVVEREDDNLKAYSYISKCCNAEGRYLEAAEAARSGLKINDDYVNLYVNKGVALYHLKEYGEAVEALTKVISNRNTIHTAAVESAYRFRGLAYEELDETEKALSDYQNLLRYNPDRKEIKKRVNELELQLEDAKPKSRLSSIFKRKK